MRTRASIFLPTGPGWGIGSRGELPAGASDAVSMQLGAVTRRLALRAQQMTFCSAAQSPYTRCAAELRRPPC